jgi:hypothetical protein
MERWKWWERYEGVNIEKAGIKGNRGMWDVRRLCRNCAEMGLLCQEFGAERLSRACDAFVQPVSVEPDLTVGFHIANAALKFGAYVNELKSELVLIKCDCERLILPCFADSSARASF